MLDNENPPLTENIRSLNPSQCLLVFCKDLCEAKHEMQSEFKFSDVLFACQSDGPPVVEVSGQVNIFVRSLGQAELWSDVPPVGGN